MKRSSRNYAEGESPRERIVNAARRLFGSQGFYATTTAVLAQEASVRVEIGSASCRERVCTYVSISVVAGSLQQHQANNAGTCDTEQYRNTITPTKIDTDA